MGLAVRVNARGGEKVDSGFIKLVVYHKAITILHSDNQDNHDDLMSALFVDSL